MANLDSGLLLGLRRRGVPVNTGQGGEISICCPYCIENGHTADFEFKLGINLRSDKAHCFRCDFKTRHASKLLVRKLELGELAPAAYEEQKKKVVADTKLPDDFELLLPNRKRGSLHKRAYEYLRQRGIDDKTMDRHDIGISLCGKYAYRIIFPVYVDGMLCGVVSRDFTGTHDKLKYLNSVGDKAIFNIPKVKQRVAVLVEGIFDALRIEIGLRLTTTAFWRPDCLGLLGHALTEDQERLLKGYKKLVLWPDGDLVGCKGFGKLGDRLHSFFKLEYVMPETLGVDPGDLSDSAIRNKYGNRSKWTPGSADRLSAWAVFTDD